jgi:two-component system, chemotaxis family, response regulator Rcp1
MFRSPSVLAPVNTDDLAVRHGRSPQVLLVEDSPTDAMMIGEILAEAGVGEGLHVVEDGMQALEFLRRQGPYRDAPRPDLILLDLQLPRKNGQEVLAEIKGDVDLRAIPVVVLSSSRDERDIAGAYGSFANSYVAKPIDYEDFADAVRLIERFWLRLATRPED